ncbi:MAG: outer membrane lipoprotein-sorting protein [Ignavibacteria bacterium]|nr:outer membrane lipoprotein-sorting protein [Ignavibacteria bacterium]
MKNLIFLFTLTIFATISVTAQTVDEILEEHFAVIGQDKLLETNTFSTTGKIMQGQMEIPFTSYHKRPMYFRSEATFQGMEIITAFDGEEGWAVNPFAGSTDPIPMTAEQVDRMTLQADYDGMLHNYKAKDYQVEFIGTETVDDIETYVLKLTRPNGDIINTYIDSENYVILKTSTKMKMQGVEVETESFYSNYKYVNDMLSPFSLETKRDGQTVMQMTFDEVNYDLEIEESLFALPEVTAPTDSTDTTDTDEVKDKIESEEKPE